MPRLERTRRDSSGVEKLCQRADPRACSTCSDRAPIGSKSSRRLRTSIKASKDYE